MKTSSNNNKDEKEDDEGYYSGPMGSLCASMEELSLRLFDLPDEPQNNRRENEDINTLLEVDTNYLNFGSFYPGKIFKCTIAIKNLTDSDRFVSLSYDDTAEYSQSTVLKLFATSGTRAIPPLFHTLPSLQNSEASLHCWYFMQPPSKAFDKRVTLQLPPRATVQVGVVIKSPCITKSEKFYSVLKIGLDPEDPRAEEVDPAKAELRVVSVAEVITPRLECCRELVHTLNGLRIVPLVVHMEGAIQRLKIPFRNGGVRDLDLQLSIVKFPGNTGGGNEAGVDYHCVPGAVKLVANSMAFINVALSQSSSFEMPDSRPIKEQRILIAKVKDTQMMYSYILDCTFI